MSLSSDLKLLNLLTFFSLSPLGFVCIFSVSSARAVLLVILFCTCSLELIGN